MKRVAVLRGGPSEEFDVSLKTGAEVLRALKDREYRSKDVIITKSGEWLQDGRVVSPDHALDAVDVVFIALHGTYGEDGVVQRIIERHRIPYTGSTPFPSATAFNKELTKQMLLEHDIKMPRHVSFTRTDLKALTTRINETVEYLGDAVVLKPIMSGSSVGVSMVRDPDLLESALLTLLKRYPKVMVEELIAGKEATCGVLQPFRDEALYALPVIEIVPAANRSFFDYTSKYDGSTDEICPGRFSYEEKATIADIASTVHTLLGLTQLSRSDFMVKDGTVYFLEVNTLPGLTSESLFPKAANAVGLRYPDLISHLIETATP